MPVGLTAQKVVDRYLGYLSARIHAGDFSAGARARVARHLHSFCTHLGEQTIETLRQHHLTEWWMGNFERWRSDYTRRDAKDAILSCFRWAESEELIERSPFRAPRFRLLIQPRPAIRWADYLRLLIECMPCHVNRKDRVDLPEYRRHRRHGSRALKRALFFMAYTGARPGEMREARWQDYDEVSGVIVLYAHKTARQSGKARLIGLPAKVRRILSLMRRRQSSGHIFVNAEGRPWTKDVFCRHFRRHADRAGLDRNLVVYGLRHGWAVHAIENGLGERQVADQMGHETTRMVSHYARQTRTNAQHLVNVAEAATRRK